MANLGFGLNINETAQEYGHDQFGMSLFQSLKAVGAENWNFNPISSINIHWDLQSARRDADKSDYIDRQELNTKYKDLGLFFMQDEPQSVVDVMVKEKKEERKRQSIIQRGPAGSWNPFSGGFYVGGAKLLTGVAVSMLDPINLGMSFIPIVGQARFAAMVGKVGFTTARLGKGALEGAVGATLLEPLIYSAAKSVKADYTLVDSFLNIGFGTVIGGGLHVGVGKLKDMNTARKFKNKVNKARENLNIKSDAEPELNLYREYYPENSKIMMHLEKVDPETRKVLLAKSVGDLLSDKPVDVTPIAHNDPILKTSTETTKLPDINVKPKTSNIDKVELNTAEKNVVKRNNVETDSEIKSLETQLETIKLRQKDMNLKFDEETSDMRTTKDELDEVNSKSKDLDEIVKDAINCVNGR